jgi:hypothetical protein
MLIGSFTALLLTLWIYGDSGLGFASHYAASPVLTVSALFAVSLFAAGWEAASSRGLDNLSVPFAAAFALHVCFASGVTNEATRFIAGTFLGSGIAFLAWRLRLLTFSGAIATFFTCRNHFWGRRLEVDTAHIYVFCAFQRTFQMEKKTEGCR